MPTTTSAFTACDSVLELDNASGVLTDISGSSSSADINFDNKIGEFRTFADVWMNRVQCGKDAKVTIKGIASTNAAEIRRQIENWFFNGPTPLRTFRIAMPNNSPGSQTITMEVLLSTFKFSPDAESAQPVMYEIELLPSGAVLYGDIS